MSSTRAWALFSFQLNKSSFGSLAKNLAKASTDLPSSGMLDFFHCRWEFCRAGSATCIAISLIIHPLSSSPSSILYSSGITLVGLYLIANRGLLQLLSSLAYTLLCIHSRITYLYPYIPLKLVTSQLESKIPGKICGCGGMSYVSTTRIPSRFHIDPEGKRSVFLDKRLFE